MRQAGHKSLAQHETGGAQKSSAAQNTNRHMLGKMFALHVHVLEAPGFLVDESTQAKTLEHAAR